MRNITLEGNLIAPVSGDMAELRRQLLRIFTPKQAGILRCGDRQIPCHVEEAGIEQGNSRRAPAFFISLLCPSPYFEAVNAIRAELAAWFGGFSFPLEVPESGLEMGFRQPSQIITIDNDGDAACGCEIIFHALGTVTNPSLLNVDTSEYLRLLTDLKSGQEVHAFTHFAGKRVELRDGGASSNAFAVIDTGSTFLQLRPGKNVMKYDADDNLDLLEVTVIYRPLYISA
jgi:hypothetical protein